ncbi:MAG TPA: nitroreductase/quinone reductase family protein [Solirubrobacterales bacterium]|nr:nitroreductase/quinone reductase family protein [Solirubrobacterales bacterium]
MGIQERIVRRLGHARLVAVLGRRFGFRVDRRLYAATGGRLTTLGRDTAPMLLLTTVGRRSGLPRTVPVIFVRDGESYVISSENFGQRRPAAWPLNLDANPRAVVQVGSTVMNCTARRLGEREANRYWERLVDAWPAHDTYRQRSGVRHTFVLTPSPGGSRADVWLRPS